jgi:hypothetical protein
LSDTSTEARKSTVLQKILKYPGPDEPDDQREAHDDARVKSRDGLSLELRFSDGRRRAFAYAFLAETDFDFSEDGEVITLYFGRSEVKVSGRCLLGLYERLLDQRTRFIQQGTEAEKELSQDVPYVEQIDIQRNEG